MGILVGKAYPTQIGLADHTYVKCSTGKVGWSCWGGKSGGREIVRGTGSSKQANTIATTNERAGITCYGINGVCHQSANCTLWPTGSLVSAARGYWPTMYVLVDMSQCRLCRDSKIGLMLLITYAVFKLQ